LRRRVHLDLHNGERFRKGRRLALVSVCASAALALGSLLAGWLGGSTSVLAAGVEFTGDVFASFVVYFGMLLASRPADKNHPYGHGRVEILAGLLVGLTIAAGGAAICYHAMQKINEIHPPPALYTLYAPAAAVLVKSALGTVKFRVGRRIDSASLVADAWNDTVDILSACAAMLAAWLTISSPDKFLAADHYGGFAVGLIVIVTGLRVARDSSLELLDTMPDGKLIGDIRRAALTVPLVSGVEKCFARKTGLQYHVDLHVEVDPAMTVRESHDVATQVRLRIRESIPAVADVLVHIEPAGMDVA